MIRSIVARLRPCVARSGLLKCSPVSASLSTHDLVRWKHVTSGVQGNRNSKKKAAAKKFIDEDHEENEALKEMSDESPEPDLKDS